MNGKNIGLPLITTNTEPQSLSYFKYAKNSMRVGDMNPNYSGVQMPYHPYHLPSQVEPMYKSQDVLYNGQNLGKHPFLNSYPLPPIYKNKENPIKEIRSGELVDFPDETYIPLSKFVDYKNKKELEIKMDKERQKAKEEERRRIEVYGVNGDKKPSGASDLLRFHKKNLKHWKFLKNSSNMICCYLRMKKLALGHKDLHAQRFVLVQAAKEGMAAIRDFLLPILSNIEDYCVEFFRNTIIFNSTNEEKVNKSIFVTKSFVHQLFSDLTSALAKTGDIPIEVKNVLNSYINDGCLLPYGFLSTFEFNRLEFSTDGKLTNMNLDRQGLLICFIVLYRILLADIFKRYLFYFKKIREMDLDEMSLLEIFERKLEQYEQKLKEKKERSKRKIFKRGNMPGIDEEDDEEKEKREKEEENKIFENDEIQEDRYRQRENNETMGLETHHACPPKKKKKIESDEEEDDDDISSKNKKSKKNKKSGKSSIKEEDDEDDEKEKKIKGKQYGYSGYLNKNKGKYYHEKGIYFKDNREKDVQRELIKEEERAREEKLREKLEDSNSSKSSLEEEEEEDEDNDDNNSKKSKNKEKEKDKNNDKKSKSSNTKSSKTSSVNTSKKSEVVSASKKSSYKPKNINEEFWGKDLEDKEEEERRKGEKSSSTVEIDPLQERKNRIKKLPKEMRIKILEEEREKLKLKVKHNFHVITNILHSIFRDSMTENVPLFSEYYKEKFLFKSLVFQKTHKQYSNGSDEIELSKGIIIDEETTELFMTKHQRWAQMYKLLTFQFCRDFASKCRV